MPWRGPEVPGEFPTLGYLVAEFIEARCVIPDGPRAGDPYLLTDEMLRFLLWFYRLEPDTGRFTFMRGAQLVRAQKWGKSPFGAAVICPEAHPEGPVRFGGWDSAGEPVGRPVPTPWIQVLSVSEDSADNVWTALVPMIQRGPLIEDLPDTGLTRVNLPAGGRVEPVTSAADSRLGARLSFALEDEPHLWTQARGGHKLAGAVHRNLAGMGGRWMQTTNAWDPREESVAQVTNERESHGVYIDDVEPGEGSIHNKAERRKLLRRVYGDSATKPSADVPWEPWVDLERIDAEIVALLKTDPAQAERYFLNRKRASADAAFSGERWDARADYAKVVAPGSLIAVGVDGARFVDALAIVATEVESGFQWPLGIWERPEAAPDGYEHPSHEVDGAMREAFERFNVWRAYIDPQWVEHLRDDWQGRWGDKRVISWYTNRPRQAAFAVRAFTQAIEAGDVSHDGDGTLAAHVRNARRRKLNVYDDQHRQMHTIAKDRPDSPRKIDAAMAAVLSWECRGDAIAAGALNEQPVSRDFYLL